MSKFIKNRLKTIHYIEDKQKKEKMENQIKDNGFCDLDLNNLFTYLAEINYKSLLEFRKKRTSKPINMSNTEWDKKLGHMISGFWFYWKMDEIEDKLCDRLIPDNWCIKKNKKDFAKYQEVMDKLYNWANKGLELYGRWFNKLWT